MKARIKQSRWGNWYGYLGRKRAREFANSACATAKQSAQRWLAEQNGAEPEWREVEEALPEMGERVEVKGVHTPEGMGWPIAYRRAADAFGGGVKIMGVRHGWRWGEHRMAGLGRDYSLEADSESKSGDSAMIDEELPKVGTIKTAWELIGWDDGLVRIVGGRATYEAVMYDCERDGRCVKLAKLKAEQGGIREIKRYVEPDTRLEIVSRG